MAVRVALSDHTHHQDDVLRTLRRLVDCERESGKVEFFFDVSLQQYSALSQAGTVPAVSGDLTLAIYNDLKLSQYILEDDGLFTRERRHFSLTARGRQVAASIGD